MPPLTTEPMGYEDMVRRVCMAGGEDGATEDATSSAAATAGAAGGAGTSSLPEAVANTRGRRVSHHASTVGNGLGFHKTRQDLGAAPSGGGGGGVGASSAQRLPAAGAPSGKAGNSSSAGTAYLLREGATRRPKSQRRPGERLAGTCGGGGGGGVGGRGGGEDLVDVATGTSSSSSAVPRRANAQAGGASRSSGAFATATNGASGGIPGAAAAGASSCPPEARVGRRLVLSHEALARGSPGLARQASPATARPGRARPLPLELGLPRTARGIGGGEEGGGGGSAPAVIIQQPSSGSGAPLSGRLGRRLGFGKTMNALAVAATAGKQLGDEDSFSNSPHAATRRRRDLAMKTLHKTAEIYGVQGPGPHRPAPLPKGCSDRGEEAPPRTAPGAVPGADEDRATDGNGQPTPRTALSLLSPSQVLAAQAEAEDEIVFCAPSRRPSPSLPCFPGLLAAFAAAAAGHGDEGRRGGEGGGEAWGAFGATVRHWDGPPPMKASRGAADGRFELALAPRSPPAAVAPPPAAAAAAEPAPSAIAAAARATALAATLVPVLVPLAPALATSWAPEDQQEPRHSGLVGPCADCWRGSVPAVASGAGPAENGSGGGGAGGGGGGGGRGAGRVVGIGGAAAAGAGAGGDGDDDGGSEDEAPVALSASVMGSEDGPRRIKSLSPPRRWRRPRPLNLERGQADQQPSSAPSEAERGEQRRLEPFRHTNEPSAPFGGRLRGSMSRQANTIASAVAHAAACSSTSTAGGLGEDALASPTSGGNGLAAGAEGSVRLPSPRDVLLPPRPVSPRETLPAAAPLAPAPAAAAPQEAVLEAPLAGAEPSHRPFTPPVVIIGKLLRSVYGNAAAAAGFGADLPMNGGSGGSGGRVPGGSSGSSKDAGRTTQAAETGSSGTGITLAAVAGAHGAGIADLARFDACGAPAHASGAGPGAPADGTTSAAAGAGRSVASPGARDLEDESMLEAIYDPMLDVYYDPRTHKYYERKPSRSAGDGG